MSNQITWHKNVFPKNRGNTTSRIKAFWCRWFHKGFRASSGLPSAGRILTHDISCIKCEARYEIIKPNTPQYSGKMPFQKPDKTKPNSWNINFVINCCLCGKEQSRTICFECIEIIAGNPKPWKRLKNKLNKLEKI